MKFKELKQMPDEELRKKASDARMELMKLNAQVATGTAPKNAGNISLLKRTLARIEFLLAERKKGGDA